jgi:hypothetical protein
MDFKNIEAKIKKWVLQLQTLPEGHKKAILWTIVVLIALPMLFFWLQGTLKRMESVESIDLGLPEFENVNQSPATEGPQNQTNGLQELQNQVNNNSQINNQE